MSRAPDLTRWNAVRTELLTLSLARCWPRLTPALSQVLEQAWLTPDLERQHCTFRAGLKERVLSAYVPMFYTKLQRGDGGGLRDLG